jgi:hypothetical protein
MKTRILPSKLPFYYGTGTGFGTGTYQATVIVFIPQTSTRQKWKKSESSLFSCCRGRNRVIFCRSWSRIKLMSLRNTVLLIADWVSYAQIV